MEEKNTKKRKLRKALIIILAVLGLGIATIQLVLMFYIDPKLEDYIKRKVTQRTQGQYSLRFENISINLFTQKIKANSVYLTPIFKKGDKKR